MGSRGDETLEERIARYRAKNGDPLDARIAAFRARTGADPDEEDEPGLLSRIGRNLGQGATQAIVGASKVNPLTYLVPGQRENLERVEQRHEELKQDPEGAVENISYYAGRLAPELLGAGGAMRGAGQLGLKGLSRVALGNIPPSATFAADKESSLVQSDNPLARFAGEYAANLAGEGAFNLAGRALRAVRRAGAAGRGLPDVPGAADDLPVMEPEVPRSATEAIDDSPALIPEIDAPYSGPTREELLSMTPREIGERVQAELDADKNLVETLFGKEGAARYNRLQAKANSMSATHEASSAAYDEIVKMENALSESQRNRLFGIGGEGILDPEELTAIKRTAHEYDPEFLSEKMGPNEFVRPNDDLLNVVGREILTGHPDESVESAIRLRESVAELKRRGMSEEAIVQRGVVLRAEREGTSPGDANDLFRDTMERLRGEARPVDDVAALGSGQRLLPAPLRKPSETIAENVDNISESLRGHTAPGAREILEKEADQQRRALNVAQQAEVDPDEFVNVSKFGLDPEGEDRLRAAVRQTVAEEGLAPKEVVPNKQTIAEAFGLDPDDILSRPAKRLNRTEMLAARNYVRTNIEEIDGLASQLKDPALPLPERERIVAEIAGREEMNNRLLGHFVQARSEAGRNLQSLKIIAQHTTDPLTWYEQAAKQLKGKPLTDTMRKDINKLIDAGDQAGLVDYVAGLRTATVGEKTATIWKAGLLTSPTTHMANFIGNTTMGFLESAKDVPGVVFDRLMGAFTGLETKAPSVRGLVTKPIQQAGGTGVKRGGRFLKDALRVLKLDPGGMRQSARSQYDEIPGLRAVADEGLDKVDQYKRVKFNNAFFDAYANSVFRLLGEGDAVFSQAAAVRSLEEQARLGAKQGLGTVEHLLDNPTDEMVLQAIADAEYATFRDRTKLGSMVSGIKRAVGTKSEAVIPFSRTPSSIATKVVIDYTPIGGGKAIYDLAKRVLSDAAMDAPLQRQIVDALGRSSVGSAPLVLGAYLMSQGLATGPLPKSESERQQFWMEGKQPWAIKVGGEWRSMERVSPAGNLLMTGAGMYRALTEAGLTTSDRATAAASTGVKMITQQPFLTGTKTVLDIATDEEFRGAGKWVGGLASSTIPNIMRGLARGIDPNIREPEGIAQQVQANIPFVSKDLPSRVDPLGGEVKRPSGVLGALFDPFKSSPDKLESDDLLRAMNAAGISIGGRDKREGESAKAYEARQRREGADLRTFLEYAKDAGLLTPELREAIENQIRSYRSQQSEQAKYLEMVQ